LKPRDRGETLHDLRETARPLLETRTLSKEALAEFLARPLTADVVKNKDQGENSHHV
jgi:hypothetical protein